MSELAGYRPSHTDAPIDVLLRSEDWRPVVRLAERWLRKPIFEATGVAPSSAGYKPEDLVDGRFLRVSPSLIDFLFGMTLRQLVTREDPAALMALSVCAASFAGSGGSEPVRARFWTRPIFDLPAGSKAEFYGSDLVLLPEVMVVARTPDVLEEARTALRSSGDSLTPEWRVE